MEHYLVIFHSDFRVILTGSCEAEIKYKIETMFPEKYLRSIEIDEDYELRIKSQKNNHFSFVF